MTGLPTNTKMKGALVSPEMEFFVQKAMPPVGVRFIHPSI